MITCSICKTLINENPDKLCKNCLEIHLNKIKKINDYLSTIENGSPPLSLKTISLETGIDEKEIKVFYETKKLNINQAELIINCKICGTRVEKNFRGLIICSKCRIVMNKNAVLLKEKAASQKINSEFYTKKLREKNKKKG